MSLKTSIGLQDNFSPVIHRIIESVNLSVAAMQDLHQRVSTPVDPVAFDSVRENIDKATIGLQDLEAAMEGLKHTEVPTPEISNPNFNWQSPKFEVFTNSGIERFKQEIASTNTLMTELNINQLQLSMTAANMDILPPEAQADMQNVQSRVVALQNSLLKITQNPPKFASAEDNAMLEKTRAIMTQIADAQNELSTAMASMNIEAINRAQLRLNNSINAAEMHVRDNIKGQQDFNNKIREGTKEVNKLAKMIKGAAGVYLTINGAKKALEISDTITSTTARLNMMNDGMQTTDELMQKIYASAERSRGSFQDTADAVSKLGIMAGDAFSSTDEIIAFTEQLNKQFAIAGTEASGVSAAMLQLTQAMGSGVLRGDEFNSLNEQAATVTQAIADYMQIPKSELKDIAAEGKITADIVKNALLSTAEETNAKFETMPRTFAQIGTSIQNTMLMAFRPIQERLSALANSEAFNDLISIIQYFIVTVANGVVFVFDLIAPVAEFLYNNLVTIGKAIADNWSTIAPILTGVAIALGIVTAAYVAYNAVKAIAISLQQLFNLALWECPLTWIIAAIVIVVTLLYLWMDNIAKTTGVASNGFALICGGINVVVQGFWNLLKSVGNVFMGVWNGAKAITHNIKTAFKNAISNVRASFYDLLAAGTDTIAGIAEALDRLPFVSIDTSGLRSKADDYAAKAKSIRESKGSYKNIKEEFDKGMKTFTAFEDGWAQKAFNDGIAWGEGISEKVANIFGSGGSGGEVGLPDVGNLGLDTPSVAGIEESLGNIDKGVGKTASNTGAIKDSLDVSEEELKYLRDLAEREVVNRFTTAEIKVDMGGITNNVKSGMDLDGIIDKLATGVEDAMKKAAEGVHV